MNENYLAPGGKEYTLTAGNLAGLNAKSKILDIACGRGVASITLAKKYGCKATAVDLLSDLIEDGKKIASAEGVGKNINFIAADFNTLHFPKRSFDLIIAEGGALSYIGKDSGLKRAYSLLKKNGYIEVSDLILRAKHISKRVKDTFAPGKMDIETEESYRTLLNMNGFEIIFCSHIAQQYWDTYYENIKQNLKNRKGIFSDKNFREELTKEIEIFYKQKGIEQLGYIFIVAKKK
jgi:ubiquinone/menaquinone biosynthesis C-methylase UbiE